MKDYRQKYLKYRVKYLSVLGQGQVAGKTGLSNNIEMGEQCVCNDCLVGINEEVINLVIDAIEGIHLSEYVISDLVRRLSHFPLPCKLTAIEKIQSQVEKFKEDGDIDETQYQRGNNALFSIIKILDIENSDQAEALLNKRTRRSFA